MPNRLKAGVEAIYLSLRIVLSWILQLVREFNAENRQQAGEEAKHQSFIRERLVGGFSQIHDESGYVPKYQATRRQGEGILMKKQCHHCTHGYRRVGSWPPAVRRLIPPSWPYEFL
jgi:hypothetical protein